MHYRRNDGMAIAHSKLTAQGQISVPACVRRKLGVGHGSVLEWDEEGENVVVRRAGRTPLVHFFRRRSPIAHRYDDVRTKS